MLSDLGSKRPATKLLYITPELLCSDWFGGVLQGLYERRKLALVAVDEAHCISR